MANGAEWFAVPERRREFGEERADSARRIVATLVPEAGGSGASWLDRASGVLADHEYDACLHGDAFGTRPFTRVRTGEDPAVRYADGPPCETPTKPASLPADFALAVE